MSEHVCGGCLDHDRIHECCRVRIVSGDPCSYVPVTANSHACLDYNDAHSIQLPSFTRLSGRIRYNENLKNRRS
jgi:hypothetical protein